MTREKFISYFFIVLLIFVVYQVILIFSPFVRAIFWSAILSFSFYPLHLRLKRLIPNETAAAILMTILIFLTVIPPVVLLILSITGQAVELYQMTSDFIRTGGVEKLAEQIRNLSFVQNLETKIVHWEPLKENASAWMLSSAKSVGNYAAAQAAAFTKNIFLIALNTAVMTFLIFIFLKDGEKFMTLFIKSPRWKKKTKNLFLTGSTRPSRPSSAASF